MDIVELWSYLTVAVTLLMCMTGIQPCSNMYRTKSTKNVPFHMFLLSGLGCQGMFHYGIMVNNGILIFLNGVGLFMQTVYVTLFLIVSRSRTKQFVYLTLAVLYDVILYTYMYKFVDDPIKRAEVLGYYSGLVTTVLMTLPAFEVIGNVRNKNADGMPQIMLLGGLACSSCWLVYGLMLNDPNVYSPNIPGLVITVIKLFVVWLYSDKRKKD